MVDFNSENDITSSFEIQEPAIDIFDNIYEVDSPISRLIGTSKRKANLI